MESLSQAGQDFWVIGEVFNEKKSGFFLELGSADGISLNNTFLLEKRYGWRGICIEAHPGFFQDLVCVRSVRCLNVCLDEDEKDAQFAVRGLFSGILRSENHEKARRAGADNSGVIKVRTRGLISILRQESAPRKIDYLSIDLEGAEERVLTPFPFGEYCFNCITIERPSEALRLILKQNGYVIIKEMPKLDVFYIHESFLQEYLLNAARFWGRYGQTLRLF